LGYYMNEPWIDLRVYRTAQGQVPYEEWLLGLESSTAGRISGYVRRMRFGNFGDSKPVGRGVSELKMDFGAGYRVYYLRVGRAVLLLLCGGDKGSQQGDIAKALAFAGDYRRRK
jgi:putative addiction module killer protein